VEELGSKGSKGKGGEKRRCEENKKEKNGMEEKDRKRNRKEEGRREKEDSNDKKFWEEIIAYFPLIRHGPHRIPKY
jgi:hypothetical protein